MNEWEWQPLEDKRPVECVPVLNGEVRVGHRVRLCPKPGADLFDLALDGKLAAIEAIEQDYEGRIYVAVVIDDDPGSELGLARQPGHRFFFAPEEVEAVSQQDHGAATSTRPRVLVAGIGNIFLGDDAFGPEVVRRLQGGELPSGVRVADFGIRGFDLAYALLGGPETTILVDACPRGNTPGTLYIVELDPTDALFDPHAGPIETHAMNPVNVLRLARSIGGPLNRILLLGCEPATLGPEEGSMGLSPVVESAVATAVELLFDLIRKILGGEQLRAAA